MKNANTKKLVGIGLLIAVVVVLQLLGGFIKFGPWSISLVLVPIVVGSALYGAGAGAILGFVFGVIVLLNDASLFLAYDVFGTVVTVLAKGTLSGLCAGLVYRALEKKGSKFAVLASSVVAPLVNTGVFILGCFIFFLPLLKTWAAGTNVVYYIFFGMIGTNFLVEMAINVALSNVIARLIKVGKDH